MQLLICADNLGCIFGDYERLLVIIDGNKHQINIS